MHLFLSDTTQGPYATLPPEESKHCVRVLRMQLGDELYVTSGDGTMCRARIVDPDPTACQVEITERLPDYGARPFKLHMAVAPTKNNARMEWFVEKAVEIGIDRITPVICDHSERGALKTDRLERIALSAMKQSLHVILPEIHPAVLLRDWLSSFRLANPTQKFIAHCEAGQPRTPLGAALQGGRDAVVLIGPEGDFSAEEIALAQEQGFQPVSLGPSRLRTETAALYVCCAFNLVNDRSL